MRVFITGVAGFLGSHLAERFLAMGHEVVGCDNLICGEMANVPPAVEFHNYDCRDFNAMLRVSKGCDMVYHCAATAYDGLSIFSPRLVLDNIATGSVSVISAAIASQARRIIFCSSMSRYGTGTAPFTEDQEPQPKNPYGIAKLAAERALINLCNTHDVEYAIAVPHNIIGTRQKFDDPYRNVASIMANLMLQQRSPYIYGDGQQTRCFSHVDDCLFCLIEMGLGDRGVGQIVNIGPDEGSITINELFRRLKEMIGFEGQALYLSDRPEEVRHAVCSSDKARSLLGYKTTRSLDDGLRDIVAYIREVGHRRFRYHLDLEIINELTPKSWSHRLM
jgi:UDP-glucose 4-epimerase